MVGDKANFRRKFAALSLGSLLSLIVFEGGLWLASHNVPSLPEAPVAGTTVLCVGGAQVMGPAVPAASTYCAQLQDLARAAGRDDLHFLGLGRAGWNTAQILAALPGWLAKYRPRKVLVMAGEENFLNYAGFQECRDIPLGCPPTLVRRFVGFVLRLRSVRFSRAVMENRRWYIGMFDQRYRDLRAMEDALGGRVVPNDREHVRVALQRIYDEAGGRGIHASAAARMMARLMADEPETHRGQLAWLERAYEAGGENYNPAVLVDVQALPSRPGYPLALEFARRKVESRLLSRERALHPQKALAALFQLSHDGVSAGAVAPMKAFEACYDDPNCRRAFIPALRSRPEHLAARQSMLEISRKRGNFGFAAEMLIEWLAWNPGEAGEAPFIYANWLRRELREPRFSSEAGMLNQSLERLFRWIPAWKLRMEWCWSRERISSWIDYDLSRIHNLVNQSGAELVLQTAPPRSGFGRIRREVDFPIFEAGRAHSHEVSDTSVAFWSADGAHVSSEVFGEDGTSLSEMGHRRLAEYLWRSERFP